MRKAVRVLDPYLEDSLDKARTREQAAQRWALIARSILRWLMHEQVELAHAAKCSSSEFDFTFATVLRGRRFAGWIQVGDASAVVSHGNKVVLCASPTRAEYANETSFVRPGDETLEAASWGVVPSEDLTAVAAFTDGVARGLIDTQTGLPGPGIGQILGKLASSEWDAERLQRYLENPRWLVGGDDDRAFAYAVRMQEPGAPDVQLSIMPKPAQPRKKRAQKANRAAPPNHLANENRTDEAASASVDHVPAAAERQPLAETQKTKSPVQA